jgi:hypothetical protein
LTNDGFLHAGDVSGVFQFKHGITRDVVYELVPLGVRRRLHAEVARAIEERFASGLVEWYEALAFHHAGACDHAKASLYAELAGDKALATSALDRARLQYAAAMAEIDRMPPSDANRRRWLQVCERWAAACVYNPARGQLDVLERHRLAHLAGVDAQVLGEPGRGGAQLRRRPGVVLVAPSPVLAPAHRGAR